MKNKLSHEEQSKKERQDRLARKLAEKKEKEEVEKKKKNKKKKKSNNEAADPGTSTSPPVVEVPVESPPEDLDSDEYENRIKQFYDLVKRDMEISNKIAEFHQRTGRTRVADMNSREQAEAKEMFERLLKESEIIRKSMDYIIKIIKKYRQEAIEAGRGDLNAIEILKLRHGCLKLVEVDNVPEPYGTGALAWPESKRLEKGEEVAAFVDESKQWILAEVVGSISNHRYECIDIDDNEKKILIFARKQLIPMPQGTCDYNKYPFMAFCKHARVLAVYPGTTCFYPGVVVQSPKISSGYYKVSFTDSDNPSAYSDPFDISERYVVAYRKDPKMYIRPEKRITLDANSEETKEFKVPKGAPKKKMAVKEPEEDPRVTDEKDVPGPAPKARPASYYESPDEDAKVSKKRKKKESVKRERKVKVLRARVPEHKKNQYKRLFGKRRKNKKKKVEDNTAGASTSSAPSDPNIEKTEEKQDDDIFDEPQSGDVEMVSEDGSLTDLTKTQNDDEETDDVKKEDESEQEEEESSSDSDDSYVEERNVKKSESSEDEVEKEDNDDKAEDDGDSSASNCGKRGGDSDGEENSNNKPEENLGMNMDQPSDEPHSSGDALSYGEPPVLYDYDSDSSANSSCHSSEGSYISENK